MIFKVSFTAKNKKYNIDLEKGQDLLVAIDKLLKSNKLELAYLKDVKVRCFGAKDSVSCRIVKLIASVLSL